MSNGAESTRKRVAGVSAFPFDVKALVEGCKYIFLAGVREGVEGSDNQHATDDEIIEQVLDATLRKPGYFIRLMIAAGLKEPG